MTNGIILWAWYTRKSYSILPCSLLLPFLLAADWDDNLRGFFFFFLEDDKALGGQFLLFLSTFLRRTTPQIRNTQLRSITEPKKKKNTLNTCLSHPTTWGLCVIALPNKYIYERLIQCKQHMFRWKQKDENLGWRINKTGNENRSKGDLNCQTIKTTLIKSKRKMKIWNLD